MANEFKRKRIYYTKAQIKTGLVTEGEEWMPQTGKVENAIHFNYYIGDELINIKYRDGIQYTRSMFVPSLYLETTIL